MSSLKVVQCEIALQQPSEIHTLAVAADRAASSGNREACIDLVERIHCLLDWTHSQEADQELRSLAASPFLLH